LLGIKEFQILNKTENDIEKLTSDNHKDLSNYEEFLKNMVDIEITNIHEAAILDITCQQSSKSHWYDSTLRFVFS
jgi:hypothetical protein